MVSVQFLTALNTWCGVLLSVVGSVTVAPKAVPQLGRMLKQDWQRLVLWLSKWLPFLRKEAGHVALRPVGTSLTATWAVASASGRVVDTSSVDAQFAQLWKELDDVRGQVEKVRSESRERAATIEARISDVEGRLQTSLVELRLRFDAAQKQQEEFDARALPLIGLGIVLTAIAGWLAGLGPWVNLTVLVIVLGFSAQVVRPVMMQAWVAISRWVTVWWKGRAGLLQHFERAPWGMQALLVLAVIYRR